MTGSWLLLLLGCARAPTPHVFPGSYARLGETGLYADLAAREVAPDLEPFTPRWVLWSDGLVKRRWLSVPAGAAIDTTDPDRWNFPVGTRSFKEFATADGQLLETRLIERIAATGDPERDWWLGAFLWREDGSDADFVPDGAKDVLGTGHDVPTEDDCHTCHNGEPGRLLGVSRVQREGAPFEADPVVVDALGVLHANCGHCHNPQGAARPDTDLDLRLRATDTKPEETGVYRTAVDQAPFRFHADGVTARVAGGDPAASAVLYRMSRRAWRVSMPPLGSEVVDANGVATVTAWIKSLPKAAP